MMIMMMIIIIALYTNKYVIVITKIKTKKIRAFREKSLIVYDLAPTCFGSCGPLSGRNK